MEGVHAEPHGGIQQHQGDEGGPQQTSLAFVRPDADDNCDRHGDPHGQQRGRVQVEDTGDDQAEDGQNDGQGEKQNQQEQQPGARRNQAAGDFAHGLPAVPQRHHQRAEVMNGTDEDGSQHDPQQSRQPAPEHGDGRAHNGPGSGNAGEVVSENDLPWRGDEVDVVLQFMTGRDGLRVELKDAGGQPASIRVVGGDETEKRPGRDEDSCHFCVTVSGLPSRF